MRIRLPTVWSSRCDVNEPALATLVSGLKATLETQQRGASACGRRAAAARRGLARQRVQPDCGPAAALMSHFLMPSGTTNFSWRSGAFMAPRVAQRCLESRSQSVELFSRCYNATRCCKTGRRHARRARQCGRVLGRREHMTDSCRACPLIGTIASHSILISGTCTRL